MDKTGMSTCLREEAKNILSFLQYVEIWGIQWTFILHLKGVHVTIPVLMQAQNYFGLCRFENNNQIVHTEGVFCAKYCFRHQGKSEQNQ